MENILYLDDYINFYNKKIGKTIIVKPYKKTLYYGKIVDRSKFILFFNKLKKQYKLNNNLLREKICIIVNSSYTIEDKNNLKEILEELNYKKIIFINELNLIQIDNKSVFINYNHSYFYFYYINCLGKIEQKIYNNDYINNKLIINIINIINKNKLIISGKNYKELITKLQKLKNEYYTYENNEELFIKLIKNKYV